MILEVDANYKPGEKRQNSTEISETGEYKPQQHRGLLCVSCLDLPPVSQPKAAEHSPSPTNTPPQFTIISNKYKS